MNNTNFEKFPPAHTLPDLPEHAYVQGTPSDDEVRYIVANGILAPSGGNFQPWKFHYEDGCLQCRMDRARTLYFTNYKHNETNIGIGAAVTNIEIAAQAIGYEVEVLPFPDALDPERICDIKFSRGEPLAESKALAKAIPYRITSRFRGDPTPLSAEDSESLQRIAEDSKAKLLVITDPGRLEEAGAILGKMNQIGYLNPESHKGIVSMMRWSAQEATETKDGIPVSTFELSPLEITGMRFLTSYQVLKYIKNLGAARSLEQMAVSWAKSASALCLLVLPEPSSPEAFFRVGRILERLWLTATLQGSAFHVLGVNSYFDRLEHGQGEGFSDEERETLKELRPGFKQLFGISGSSCEGVLFRIVPPNPLVERTLRLDVADVVSFAQCITTSTT